MCDVKVSVLKKSSVGIQATHKCEANCTSALLKIVPVNRDFS